jgi:hypothetical protein
MSNGFSPTMWGPALWCFLHMVSFSYPERPTIVEKKQYLSFVLSLEDVLPCSTCRLNFKSHLAETGFGYHSMFSRATFSKAIHRLHSSVSETSDVSYSQTKALFEGFRKKKSRFIIGVVPEKSRADGYQFFI